MAVQNDANLLKRLEILKKVINQYDWLTNSYMVDFFSQDLYSNLPKCWQKFFMEIAIEDIGRFLDIQKNLQSHKPWPLSLLSLRSLLSTFTISRKFDEICHKTSGYPSNSPTPELLQCFQHPRLKNIFSNHVKPKKRHELNKMAAETARLVHVTGAQAVLDIGSGLGHLARRLSYGYGFRVVGVEAQEQLIEKAQILDIQLEMTASKTLTTEDMLQVLSHRPTHTYMHISFNTQSHDLEGLFTSEESYGVVGLHPCGDLANILLKLFVTCPRIRFINIIGCCYHKMKLNSDSTYQGFPLSKHLSQCRTLTTEGAALACHAIETYSERLVKGDYDHLKIHCYRATLETIILKYWPHHARAGLNNVKQYPQMQFAEYCVKALKTLKLSIPDEDFHSEQTIEKLSGWRQAVIYHSLMLMLGPVLETLILCDRALYLTENDMCCQLQVGFDPAVSPRNHILSAVKLS